MSDLKHILIEGYTTELPYSTYGGGNSILNFRTNRTAHGNFIRTSFEEAVNEFSQGNVDFDFVFIEFESAVNYELAFSSFEDAKGNFRLASCKRLITFEEGEEKIIYRASVYLNKKAVSTFLKKVEAYLNEETKNHHPKNALLIGNIEIIKAATIESFWQEPIIPFPSPDDVIWWEVWFNNIDEESFNTQLAQLSEDGLIVGNRILKFPENTVVLIKGNSTILSENLLYIDNLSEIRKPIETTDFFTYLDKTWQGEFITDLKSRIRNSIEQSNTSVCLLDTGLNRVNPLLENLIPESQLETVNPHWTVSDSERSGHGTPMAGMILYGDLTEVLGTDQTIDVSANIESIKIMDIAGNDPDLYGQITLEAIALGEIMNPNNKRVVCLAITASDNQFSGKPSSWSAALDLKLFGTIEERNDNTLLVTSGGNLPLEQRTTYPLANEDFSVQDPSQSFNSITVGSFTLKDIIMEPRYKGAVPLARRGQMSPSNSTSLMWNNGWARKPDVVFEGGNDGLFNSDLLDSDSLKLLSTGVGGVGRSWLTVFSDTSAATALAARFAATLQDQYINYRPETIRALMIHSANWTSAMLQNRELETIPKLDFAKLISSVGYGVPNLEKAKFSANNALTIIAERIITPYKLVKSEVKTNNFHLYDLPWPTEVLSDLLDDKITLKVTLSYFIEPNPGNKMYADATSYQSYGLRFKMIDRNESVERFKARVSKAIKESQTDYVKEGSETWLLGSGIRDKGSIHKDLWIGSAADLALRNKIAVYPTGGWWKNRKKMLRYDKDVNYSIIISIESENNDVDIYTPVLNQIRIPISIEN